MAAHRWTYTDPETRRCDVCGWEQGFAPKPKLTKKPSANWAPAAGACVQPPRKRTPAEAYAGPRIRSAAAALDGRRAVDRAARLATAKGRRGT